VGKNVVSGADPSLSQNVASFLARAKLGDVHSMRCAFHASTQAPIPNSYNAVVKAKRTRPQHVLILT
jgi:hypothetical protein